MNRNDPVAFVKWMAQTVHQAYHGDGTWETCKKDVCASARRWIEDFFEDDKIWVTADGKVIPIREMEDSHLINAYRYLKRKVVERACMMQKMGFLREEIDIEEMGKIDFPILNDLKAEMRRRQAIEIDQYEGTRNLDI